MNQETINKVFESELGQQTDILFSTSDGRIFIRHEEACSHADSLEDKTIQDWNSEKLDKIKNLGFDVIQHEQTPKTPEINHINEFIDSNKEVISAFRDYAISRADGVGLAANQCSLNGERLNLRVIAVKDIKTRNYTIAIDPKIIKYYGVNRQKAEGCLTWGKDDKYYVIVAYRNHFVDVEYYTIDGDLIKETHKGFQAQIWQHEVNHINGIEETVVSESFILDDAPDKNTGRNDLCPCGSKLKYKRCCIDN